MRRSFARQIAPAVRAELAAAAAAHEDQRPHDEFRHLENAHVLGQAATRWHVLVHWRMLQWGWRQRRWRECAGQLLRLAGAATKTALGLVPAGNTGGSNVSPFRAMPVAPELAATIRAAGGRVQETRSNR